MEGFEIKPPLGKSSYGTTYAVRRKADGVEGCLKVYKQIKDPKERELAFQRVQTLSSVKHSGIVKIYSIFWDFNCLCIFMEKEKKGSLSRLLSRVLTSRQIAHLFRPVLRSILAMHRKHVHHGNLKPKNILISEDKKIKISDVLVIKTLLEENWPYSPPEVFDGGSASLAGDVWSLGVLFYQLSSGRLPFEGNNFEEIKRKVLNEEPEPFPDSIPEMFKELVLQMLNKDVKKRITIKSILAHHLFKKKFDFEVVRARTTENSFDLSSIKETIGKYQNWFFVSSDFDYASYDLKEEAKESVFILISRSVDEIKESVRLKDFVARKIFIKCPLKKISDECFFQFASLETISIPEGIKELPRGCFYLCYSLKNIVLPASIVSVGEGCFSSCSSLESIILPSVTKVGKVSFSKCSSLPSISLNKDIANLPDYCFSECSLLQEIEVPTSATSIGDYCFSLCSSLAKIAIPENLNYIGTQCFFKCSKLESIFLSEGVKEIPEFCFFECTSLKIGSFPCVESFGEGCFSLCSSLEELHIPRVKKFGKGTFYKCTSLLSISLPESLNDLPESCFCECSSLKSIVIPSSIAHIGDFCFSLCSSLENISLSPTILSIGKGCFSKCTSLCTIMIPELTSELSTGMFHSCSSLKEVNFSPNSSSLKKVEDLCFSSCLSLENILLPSSVENLGKLCFAKCKSIKDISIPESIKNLPLKCFEDCSTLSSINISSHVEKISSFCFNRCSNLQNFFLPNSVVEIGRNILNGCSQLFEDANKIVIEDGSEFTIDQLK